MDKRIIIVIGLFLTLVAGFIVYKLIFASKTNIQIDYVINNVQNGKAYRDSAIQFVDRTLEAKDWKWNFGDDQYSFEKNPIHAYKTSGKYRIRLTVTTPDGSSVDTNKVINIVEANPHADTVVPVVIPREVKPKPEEIKQPVESPKASPNPNPNPKPKPKPQPKSKPRVRESQSNDDDRIFKQGEQQGPG
jgi:PKD repeat protein